MVSSDVLQMSETLIIELKELHWCCSASWTDTRRAHGCYVVFSVCDPESVVPEGNTINSNFFQIFSFFFFHTDVTSRLHDEWLLYRPASLGCCCCRVCDAAGPSTATVSMFSHTQRLAHMHAVHTPGDATLAFEESVEVFSGGCFGTQLIKGPHLESNCPSALPALKSGTTKTRTQIRWQNLHMRGHTCVRAQSYKYKCLLLKEQLLKWAQRCALAHI